MSQYQQTYVEQVREASAYIRARLGKLRPQFGVVLGSGLGDVADQIEIVTTLPYHDIPNFPTPTVPGHEGQLLIGSLAGVPVIGLKGRKHYYEVADLPLSTGILMSTFAVQVLAELGVPNYFATNAAGGLNPKFQVGDLMIIKSHLNFLPNPLLGEHRPFTRVDTGAVVDRFQPMNGAYDADLIAKMQTAGQKFEKHLHLGTYLAVTGPSYETEAECLAFRDGLKADAVGMSTTPEVIVARNRGMKVIGLSCITNKIAPDGTNATNHTEVKAILESPVVKTRLATLVTNFFLSLY